MQVALQVVYCCILYWWYRGGNDVKFEFEYCIPQTIIIQHWEQREESMDWLPLKGERLNGVSSSSSMWMFFLIHACLHEFHFMPCMNIYVLKFIGNHTCNLLNTWERIYYYVTDHCQLSIHTKKNMQSKACGRLLYKMRWAM